MVDISGLEKALVLKKLWDYASYIDEEEIKSKFIKTTFDIDEAKQLTSNPNKLCFDYVNGKHIHVDISSDDFNEKQYDEFNGTNQALKAVNEAYSLVTEIVSKHLQGTPFDYSKDELYQMGL